MLKALRKYRQEPIRENRTTQYLLYAIGEIMLVAIGILIAVQINNWNERRQLKANDYEALRKDKEYRNMLKLLVGIRTFGIQLC